MPLQVLAQEAAGSDASAPAQTGTASDAGEILVTAQRRSQLLQKVPIVVQAVSSLEMVDRGVHSVVELQKFTPALTTITTSGSLNPFIRGVGSSIFGPGVSGSVGIYVDGAYLPTSFQTNVYLDDAEQIEVLEGPQGALYGRNATGGAIIIRSRTPKSGDPFSARFRAGVGNYNTQDYFGAVSGSIGEKVGVYLSASRNTRDGYIKNLNAEGLAGYSSEDLDDRDSWSAKAVVVVEPTDRLNFTLRGLYAYKNDRGGFGSQPVGLNLDFGGLNGSQAYYSFVLQRFGVDPATASAAAAALKFSNRTGATYDSELNSFQTGLLTEKSKLGSFQRQITKAASAYVSYDLDPFTISSLTSYNSSMVTAAEDILRADPQTLYTPVPGIVPRSSIGFSGVYPVRSIQEDNQLTSTPGSAVQWVAGAQYLDTRGPARTAVDFPFGARFFAADAYFKIKSVYAFAQVTVPLFGDVSATLGGRYTRENYTLEDRADPTDPNYFPGTVNQGTQNTISRKFTYTARLEYDRGPLLVYAGVVTGFKAGLLSASNTANPAVEPETITSYEAGGKWRPIPSLTVNGAVFHYDYKHIQVSTLDNSSGTIVVVNGPAADVTGADLAINWRVADWLELRSNSLLLHTEYKSDSPASGSVGVLRTAGRRLVGAPKYVFNVGGDLTLPQVTSGELKLAVDATFNSGYYLDPENLTGTGGITDKSYAQVDAVLSYKPFGSFWRASIYGTNLTDSRPFTNGNVSSGLLRIARATSPRTYGARIQFDF